jgi:G2/mitotic-specific cyclin 2
VGNNLVGTRKRAALGDVTNAHKKSVLGDITNAVLKKETTVGEKNGVKRGVSRKIAGVTVTKPAEKTAARTTASVVIPKKRPSEAVAPLPLRRTLTQSLSTTSLAARSTVARRQVEESESEAPRKKQKVEKKQDWDDLDAADVHDPSMVSEYVNEIFDYMRELEVHVRRSC